MGYRSGYKGVIFDLDGTLVDTIEDLTDAVNYALGRYGQPLRSVEQCRQMVGDGIKVLVERALEPQGRHLRDEVVRELKAYYRGNCLRHSRLYDGIADLIKALKKRGMRLAVLTNKTGDDARCIISRLFGEGVFDCVAGVDGDGPVKPDPACVNKVIAGLGLSKEEVLLVGDSEVDVETSRAAGVRLICVGWGFRSREELEQAGAEEVVETPGQILELPA